MHFWKFLKALQLKALTVEQMPSSDEEHVMLLSVEPMLDICGAVDSRSVFFSFSTVGGSEWLWKIWSGSKLREYDFSLEIKWKIQLMLSYQTGALLCCWWCFCTFGPGNWESLLWSQFWPLLWLSQRIRPSGAHGWVVLGACQQPEYSVLFF